MKVTPELLEAAGVVALVGWLHHQWHVRRYPDRACSECGGTGKATGTDMFDRKVVGRCRKCRRRGSLRPRRRSQR